MPSRSRRARIVARKIWRLIARAAALPGSGSTSGVVTHRSFSTLTGPLTNSTSLRPILPRSRPEDSLGVRVASELSHNTRRVRASSRRTWWFEVGSSCQSFANATIGVSTTMHDNCPMAVLATRWDGLVRGTCVRAVIAAWLMGTCAASPGCRRLGPVDRGPDLQIVGESTRLRTTDPVPATSPWFDGTKVAIVAARGEHIGLQVLHRGGGPVDLTFRQPDGASRSADVRQFSVAQFEVHRPSTELYGGSHGAGWYADGLQI